MVIRWIARSRTGETTARLQGRRRVSRLDAHEAFIVGLIEERKDITLNEIMARLVAERFVVIDHSALSCWLRAHDWTFKKDRPCTGAGWPAVLKRRRDWFEAQPELDSDRLVFIDETGLSTKMARLRGRTLRGQRFRAGMPQGHLWTPFWAQAKSWDRRFA